MTAESEWNIFKEMSSVGYITSLHVSMGFYLRLLTFQFWVFSGSGVCMFYWDTPGGKWFLSYSLCIKTICCCFHQTQDHVPVCGGREDFTSGGLCPKKLCVG